ncbi:MAG TPA: hypothetical protein VNL39_10835 [Xanthobacteraceae bacterium]|nr:hypothetical protein [Xanthobacteraceae bacterium]
MVRTVAAVIVAALVFVAFIFIVSFPPAVAQAPNPGPASAAPTPMRFEWVREGPAEQCGDHCREWISATGAIADSTVQDFAAFARQRDVRGAVIVLDSPGGNVVQGLALGREFRRLRVTTSVGRTVKLVSDAGGEQRAALSPHATCNSMCVFLLLGGVRRHIPAEARIFVHQIWPSSKRNDANAATYSATNVATIQRVNGEIGRYIVDMGVHIELFEIASRIPPWEEMRLLSREELQRMKVHTVDDPFAKTPTLPATAAVAARKAAPIITSLGWAFVEQDGQHALIRRHPITIEGLEIGQFELAFSCSDKPDTYQVTYREKRIMADSPAGAADRLESVSMSVRRNNSPQRPVLSVEESRPENGSAHLLSRAHGKVPASFLETIATPFSGDAVVSSSQQGLIVTTTTVEKVRTAIRLGQTGLAEGLRQLARSCGDAPPN